MGVDDSAWVFLREGKYIVYGLMTEDWMVQIY